MYILETGLVIAFIVTVYLFYKLHNDISLLRNFLHDIHRGPSFRGRNNPLINKFFLPQVEALWRSILIFNNHQQTRETSKNIYKRLISLTTTITSAANSEEATAEAISTLILSEFASEVVAVGVVLKNSDKDAAYIPHLAGISRMRVSETILSCFDELYEETSTTGFNETNWGVLTKKSNLLFDFTNFNIDMSLFVPIKKRQDNADGISGAIWLGLKSGATGFTNDRLEFIQAVTEHATISFTATKKVKEQISAGDNERDFLLGVSHDIRTPAVRAFAALSEVLRGGTSLSLIDRECLKIAEESLAEQNILLADIFDCARGERGLLKINQSNIGLKSLLIEAIGDFPQRVEAKGLAWNFSPDSIPDTLIKFDASHFRRVINNLLNNALKYTVDGEISLEVIPSSKYLEVIITDSGIGVLPRDREILFKTFHRGQNSSISSGLGLGLRLSACLTEINKGLLCYRPVLDKNGSCFVFSVPLTDSKEILSKSVVTKTAFSSIAGRLLVVEDDLFLGRLIKRILSSVASHVEICTTIEDALIKINSTVPDIVVTDYHLGCGTAEDFLKNLLETTPVIILTSDASGQAHKLSLTRNNTLLIEKPFNEELLIREVSQLASHGVSKIKCA